jgi:hypothetical protein
MNQSMPPSSSRNGGSLHTRFFPPRHQRQQVFDVSAHYGMVGWDAGNGKFYQIGIAQDDAP